MVTNVNKGGLLVGVLLLNLPLSQDNICVYFLMVVE